MHSQTKSGSRGSTNLQECPTCQKLNVVDNHCIECGIYIPGLTRGGKKNDQGKLPYELLPFSIIDGIVKVQQFGAKKYGPNNWQKVSRGKKRYIAAALRHISQVQQGRRYDDEGEGCSGLPHLHHALCSLIYAAWIDEQHIKRHKK